MKHLLTVLMMMPMALSAQTLAECHQAAEKNYSLIREYGLIEKTAALTVANLQTGWLPQVSATAQATLQSDVMSWPEQMKTMLSGMGIDVKGLRRDQYRVGVDVSQTVYDGGMIGSQKAVAREQARLQAAQTDVEMYAVRKRVNEMYFTLLLLDAQQRLNGDLQRQLEVNERTLASMVKGGTAAESDLRNVQAERLTVVQQATDLASQKRMLLALLSAFCGIEVTQVSKPAVTEAGGPNNRPELRVFDAQISLAATREKALDAAVRPRLGVFAQGYYGYPGYNMFEDMMSRRWSLNAMIGVRLSWNIGALYTRGNDKAQLRLQRDQAELGREVFLFNSNLEQIGQMENIARYRQLMAEDEEIIQLRAAVRKAAESKLAHGIIDVHDLVREITAENAARVRQSIHEIEMLKEIYDNKYTTNNQ